MKKLLCALLISAAGFAQDSPVSPLIEKKNEFRFDVLSLVGFGKANLSYERFLGEDWSVGVTGSFAFSDKVDKDFDRGYRNTLPKTEIIPYVRYRLSESFSSYYFVEAFASFNNGDFREIVRTPDAASGSSYYAITKEGYFDVALGGSIGYKVYFAESVALEFLVGGGYNMIDQDKSPDLISRIGINLGYRF